MPTPKSTRRRAVAAPKRQGSRQPPAQGFPEVLHDDNSDNSLSRASSVISALVAPSGSSTPENKPVDDHSAGVDPPEPCAPEGSPTALPNLAEQVRLLETKLSQERFKWANMMAMKRFSKTDVPEQCKEEQHECLLCFTYVKNTAFVPCGHMCCCFDCAGTHDTDFA